MTEKQTMRLQQLIKDVCNYLSFIEDRKTFARKLKSFKINGEYHTCIDENTEKSKPTETLRLGNFAHGAKTT